MLPGLSSCAHKPRLAHTHRIHVDRVGFSVGAGEPRDSESSAGREVDAVDGEAVVLLTVHKSASQYPERPRNAKQAPSYLVVSACFRQRGMRTQVEVHLERNAS